MAKTPAAAAKKPAKSGNNLIARFLLRIKIPSNNVRGAQLAERDKALVLLMRHCRPLNQSQINPFKHPF
jgi:hypothetical protein